MTMQQKLLAWFHKYQRPLPWRRHYRPYEVWVSEIMLQQTQMDTVLPYFERWMKAFPTLKALAASDEKKVLKLWEGLGYYSRARNIHKSAKEIVSKHGGEFPSDFDAILALKGIGRYTAGAIASIAFNEERPIVDGNVLRVLSRIYAIKDPIDIEKNKPRFWELQEKLIPKGKARWFNQAVMELGALVCTPREPSCALCPILSFCRAAKTGDAEDYPFRARRRKTVKVDAAAVVLENRGRYLLRLRPLGKIMGGLWEFPEWKLNYGRGPVNAFRTASGKVKELIEKEFGLSVKPEQLGKVKRNYTHHLENLSVFSAKTNAPVKPKTDWPHAWVSKEEFGDYPFSSAHAKIAALIFS